MLGDAHDAQQFCELRELGGCSGPLERHHILNRGKLRNVEGALAYCEEHSDILIANVCHAQNTARLPDQPRWRAYLLQKRVDLFGAEYVAATLDGLRSLCRLPPPEWRLDALLAGFTQTTQVSD